MSCKSPKYRDSQVCPCGIAIDFDDLPPEDCPYAEEGPLPTERTFKRNTLYKLSPRWAEYYSQKTEHNPEGRRYEYVKSLPGSQGTIISDCWLMDAKGKKHPGYINNPIPVNIASCTEVHAK